ncbi:WD40 repeat-like protein [Panus rudis PR-1116 ss-1]|nr:WD40 repeat-like protein [Panus rudis PR-1116 ss-1]
MSREDMLHERLRAGSSASFGDLSPSSSYFAARSLSVQSSRASSPAIPNLPSISCVYQLRQDRLVLDLSVPEEDAKAGICPLAWSGGNIILFSRGNRIHFRNMSLNEDVGQLTKIRSSHGNLRAIECGEKDNYPHSISVLTSKGHIQLFDLSTKTMVTSWQTKGATSMKWNGPVLTVAEKRGTIRHFDTRLPSGSKEHMKKVTRHQAEITCLAWHPDGKFLASGDQSGLSHCWDTRKPGVPLDVGEMIQRRKKMQHDGPVTALTWCPWSDKLLASGDCAEDNTGTIRFWDVKDSTSNSNMIRNIPLDASITSLQFSEHSKEILSTHGVGKYTPGTVQHIYNAEQDRLIPTDPEPVPSDIQHSVVVHYYPTLYKILTRKAAKTQIASSAVSPNGQRIVLGIPEEGKLKIWDVWSKPKSSTYHQMSGLALSAPMIR